MRKWKLLGIDNFLRSRPRNRRVTVNLSAATILLNYPFSPLRLIQCLVCPLFVTLSSSSLNISNSKERLNTFSQSIDRALFFRQTNIGPKPLSQMLNFVWPPRPTMCNIVQQLSDSTMLDDVGSVWSARSRVSCATLRLVVSQPFPCVSLGTS